ncbi:hypothetical protein [Cupriavidus sp. H18C1]|uniref:hypothetical protein n=1 Tax=Cupriavidus sp. H18C1 TaxID=3241601 RepID=UPI003BB891DB
MRAVTAAPLIDVREIDADRALPDLDFAFARRRHGDFDELQFVRPAVSLYLYCRRLHTTP